MNSESLSLAFLARSPGRDLFDARQDFANVVRGRARVHDYNAQYPVSIEYRGTNIGEPAFVELLLDCPMAAIRVATALPQLEAKDIRVRPVNRFENFRLRAVVECGFSDVANVSCEMVPNFRAVSAPYQPDLQRIEALRAGNGELAEIGPAPL